MDQKTVTVINWMALTLMVPAAIGLAWKTVNDTLKGNGLSSDVITASLLLGLVGRRHPVEHRWRGELASMGLVGGGVTPACGFV